MGDYGVATEGEGEGGTTVGSGQVPAQEPRGVARWWRVLSCHGCRPGGALRPDPRGKDSAEQGLRGHRADVCLC